MRGGEAGAEAQRVNTPGRWVVRSCRLCSTVFSLSMGQDANRPSLSRCSSSTNTLSPLLTTRSRPVHSGVFDHDAALHDASHHGTHSDGQR